MRKIFFAVAALFVLHAASAQFTQDYLKAADEYYKKGDYFSAAQYYEKFLAANGKAAKSGYKPYVITVAASKDGAFKTTTREEAVYNAGESYRQLNYHIKAEPFYKEAASYDKANFPLAKYYYGTTLKALQKFAEAETALTQFKDEYGQQDLYADAAQREILNLRFIQQQLTKKDLSLYNVAKAGSQLNDTGATYAPVWVAGQTLLFTSTRPDMGSKKGTYINKVYEATYAGGAVTSVTKAVLPQLTDVHQGVVAVTPDGGTLYLTRWTIGEGKRTAAIYTSKRTDGGWSEPALVTSLNTAGANSQQPFVMPDGQQLLFASDRTGGVGGFDLYMASLNADGSVGQPTNLGTNINTPFDEQAPYYHAPSQTLVFASNGRVGMGEYDLFFTKKAGVDWAAPQNFGYPVNSVKDDIYFASRGTAKNILGDVLFSSDRSSACCLELFSLTKTRSPRIVVGTVVDCETNVPLATAAVEAKGADNQVVFSGTTSGSGMYQFKMEEYEGLQIAAKLEGYTGNAINAATPTDEATESFTAPVLCLNKIPVVGTVEVLEHVYFEYDKAVVLDESHASLDKLVKRLNDNPTIAIEISGHTDSKGNDKYNQKLSEARAKSVVDYIVSQGIERSRLIAKGYGEAQPLAPNTNPDGTDNPKGREQNRRTEFKVIRN